jgi:hypothetical protein
VSAPVVVLSHPHLCRRATCGNLATVRVVDLPDSAQGDHLATLSRVLGSLDAPSVLDLCTSCAGDPAGWDSYMPLTEEVAA